MGLFNFAGKEKAVIKNSRLLTDGTLDAIHEHNALPTDIRLLAKCLKDRWWKGDTDPDLMRGISKSVSRKKDGRAYTHNVIEPDYPFKVSPNYAGEGSLTLGQWWPLQICAFRDGAHGETEAGIHGLKAEGAFSIIVSGAGYANIDEGDTLHYCGTTNVKDVPSYHTKLLLTSFKNEQSIRVLRSAKGKSKYKPSHGVRYDGLYKIKSFEIIDVDTALHRFEMRREHGQKPIQYEGASVRPHKVEVEAMLRDKELRAQASG